MPAPLAGRFCRGGGKSYRILTRPNRYLYSEYLILTASDTVTGDGALASAPTAWAAALVSYPAARVPTAAADLAYDNTDSGLTAVNLQDAVDEVALSRDRLAPVGCFTIDDLSALAGGENDMLNEWSGRAAGFFQGLKAAGHIRRFTWVFGDADWGDCAARLVARVNLLGSGTPDFESSEAYEAIGQLIAMTAPGAGVEFGQFDAFKLTLEQTAGTLNAVQCTITAWAEITDF